MNEYDREEQLHQLLMRAIRFISFRLRSESEIRQFLQKSSKRLGFEDQTVITDTCERLAELGYYDDSRFTSWWIGSRMHRNQKGFLLIQDELRRKGVARSVIEQCIKEFRSQVSEEDLIRQIYQKKQN